MCRKLIILFPLTIFISVIYIYIFHIHIICDFIVLIVLQIKIWFQNRRTKWKRKYTNDVELLAQQYYSSLGIPAPRPIFVGDRLWCVLKFKKD